MSGSGERAEALFCAGDNCAQSTFAAFCGRMGLEEKTALRLASGLGAGVGRQREVCGAVLGMTMAAGLLLGCDDPADGAAKTATYAMVQDLCAQFKARHGSIVCRTLLGLEGESVTPVSTPRTAAFYRDRPCGGFCRDAADLLDAQLTRSATQSATQSGAAAPEKADKP